MKEKEEAEATSLIKSMLSSPTYKEDDDNDDNNININNKNVEEILKPFAFELELRPLTDHQENALLRLHDTLFDNGYRNLGRRKLLFYLWARNFDMKEAACLYSKFDQIAGFSTLPLADVLPVLKAQKLLLALSSSSTSSLVLAKKDNNQENMQQLPLKRKLSWSLTTDENGNSPHASAVLTFIARKHKLCDDGPGSEQTLYNALVFLLHYVMSACSDDITDLVVVIDMLDVSFDNFDYNFTTKLLELCRDEFPIRVRALYIINSPWWMNIIVNNIPSKFRCVHVISLENLIIELGRECLPKELGGYQDVVTWNEDKEGKLALNVENTWMNDTEFFGWHERQKRYEARQRQDNEVHETCDKPDVTLRAPNVAKRKRIIGELLSTEASYVANLWMIHEVFELPLHVGRICTDEELDLIFSGMNDVRIINSAFNKKLVSAIEQEDHNDMDISRNDVVILKRISQAFFELSQHTASYVAFVSKYSEALDTILKLNSKRSLFTAYLQEAASNFRAGKIKLTDHLLCPIQRLPRYVLLLSELEATTEPAHPAYSDVKKMGECVIAMADAVNEARRKADIEQHMQFLARNIRGLPVNFQISTPERVFIVEVNLVELTFRSNKVTTGLSSLNLFSSPSTEKISLSSSDMNVPCDSDVENNAMFSSLSDEVVGTPESLQSYRMNEDTTRFSITSAFSSPMRTSNNSSSLRRYCFMRNVTVYLFNDILILVKRKEKKKVPVFSSNRSEALGRIVEVERRYKLHASLTNIAAVTRKGTTEFPFIVEMTINGHVHIFASESANAQKDWIQKCMDTKSSLLK